MKLGESFDIAKLRRTLKLFVNALLRKRICCRIILKRISRKFLVLGGLC